MHSNIFSTWAQRVNWTVSESEMIPNGCRARVYLCDMFYDILIAFAKHEINNIKKNWERCLFYLRNLQEKFKSPYLHNSGSELITNCCFWLANIKEDLWLITTVSLGL